MNSEDADFKNRVENQVVGQLFFQSVTQVDPYKSRFSLVRP